MAKKNFILKRTSPIPLYYQLAEEIERQITEGLIEDQGNVLSESRLVSEYGVSRITVRGGLEILHNKGLIKKVQGKGTFIQPNGNNKNKVKTSTIGVVVPEATGFFSKIITGIENTLKKFDYHIILSLTGNDEKKENAYINKLVNKYNINGFLVCPANRHLAAKYFNMLNLRKISFVLFPVINLSRAREFNYVVSDDEQGACLAVSYLIKLGHRKIGLLSPPEISKSAFETYRISGYRKALLDAGLKFDETLIFFTNSREVSGGYKKTPEILKAIKKTKITALFAAKNSIGIGFLKRAREKGIKIPEELSLIGMGHYEKVFALDIQLTTVRQPVYEIGQRLGEILVKIIEKEPKKLYQEKIPYNLFLGNTTARKEVDRFIKR